MIERVIGILLVVVSAWQLARSVRALLLDRRTRRAWR